MDKITEKLKRISIIQCYSAYLAHPSSFEKEAKVFQKELEDLGITVINPFVEERKEFEHSDSWKPDDWWKSPHSPQEAEHIVERDLEWIRGTDALISFVPEPHAFGTQMEIFYAAKLLEKPVFIYTSKKYRFHPWIMYFGQVFTDRRFMLDVLRLRQKLEGVPFRIAIGGKMGTGKSSLADFLVKCFQFKKYSFAAKLKQLATDLFNMETKDRQLLQILGTKVRDINKDVWAQYITTRIQTDNPLRAVIDDMRYLNEAEILKKNKFLILKLYTPKSLVAKRGVAGFNEKTSQHPSEIEIDAIKADYTIDTSGTLEECYQIMIEILSEKGWLNKRA